MFFTVYFTSGPERPGIEMKSVDELKSGAIQAARRIGKENFRPSGGLTTEMQKALELYEIMENTSNNRINHIVSEMRKEFDHYKNNLREVEKEAYEGVVQSLEEAFEELETMDGEIQFGTLPADIEKIVERKKEILRRMIESPGEDREITAPFAVLEACFTSVGQSQSYLQQIK